MLYFFVTVAALKGTLVLGFITPNKVVNLSMEIGKIDTVQFAGAKEDKGTIKNPHLTTDGGGWQWVGAVSLPIEP